MKNRSERSSPCRLKDSHNLPQRYAAARLPNAVLPNPGLQPTRFARPTAPRSRALAADAARRGSNGELDHHLHFAIYGAKIKCSVAGFWPPRPIWAKGFAPKHGEAA